jgi:hypothetical protein
VHCFVIRLCRLTWLVAATLHSSGISSTNTPQQTMAKPYPFCSNMDSVNQAFVCLQIVSRKIWLPWQQHSNEMTA